MEEREFFERFINYEIALSKFFRELELKPNQCQLIRAFMLISKGETTFEASFSELSEIFNKKTSNKRIDSSSKSAFKGLEKWQDEHQIQLVKIIVKGHRYSDESSGKFNYVKSQFEFVVLDELVKLIYSDAENLDAVIERALDKVKAQYTPVEKVKLYRPNHLIRKAKNTIYTKLGKIFELAIEAGANPVEQCEKVLNQAWQLLSSLEEDWGKRQYENQFIKDFEIKYKSTDILNKQEENLG